ncbi:MAG: multicopper oxidase domain-containing protein [Nitrosopumilaceae archaeon]
MQLVKTMKRRMLLSLTAASFVAIIYFSLPILNIDATKEPKTFLTHSGAVIQTTGDVIDPIGYSGDPLEFNPDKYLREFSYGRVSKLSDGTTLREFTIIAEDNKIMEISPGVFFNVWTFNGTTPGPTIRATEGDIVRIKFINNGSKPHSMHFHGIHPSEMDGLESVGQGGGQFTYEFVAGPVGVHPYHCHVMPLEEHISRGMYGVYIVDPKEGRPKADEMVMVLNGFDTDFDTENNFYAANTIPFYYQHHPIQINTNELIRVYVVNILEFDQINNLHLHGNLFDYYPTGTYRVPSAYTDIITLSQGERGIMEFNYTYPGKYLFHAHKTEFAEKGWTGLFLVKESENTKQYGD